MIEPTRIQVYKQNPKSLRIFGALFIIIASIGLWGLIRHFFSQDFSFASFNQWNFLTLFFQGAVGVGFIWKAKNSKKYFAEWNHEALSYWLPKSNETVHINFKDIASLDIGMRKVDIRLHDQSVQSFNLNFFYYPQRQNIKDFFTGLQARLEPVRKNPDMEPYVSPNAGKM